MRAGRFLFKQGGKINFQNISLQNGDVRIFGQRAGEDRDHRFIKFDGDDPAVFFGKFGGQAADSGADFHDDAVCAAAAVCCDPLRHGGRDQKILPKAFFGCRAKFGQNFADRFQIA